MKQSLKKIINTERVISERPLQNKHISFTNLKRLPPLTMDAFKKALSEESKRQLTEMTGAVSEAAGLQIINTLIRGVEVMRYAAEEDRQAQCNAAMAILHELDPQDAVEGMICAQMVMLFLLTGYGIYSDYNDGRYRSMDVFMRSVETLSKYRNKGKQHITVQHVNINEGANAVIGDVNHLK